MLFRSEGGLSGKRWTGLRARVTSHGRAVQVIEVSVRSGGEQEDGGAHLRRDLRPEPRVRKYSSGRLFSVVPAVANQTEISSRVPSRPVRRNTDLALLAAPTQVERELPHIYQLLDSLPRLQIERRVAGRWRGGRTLAARA